jgi:hypothetical protein
MVTDRLKGASSATLRVGAVAAVCSCAALLTACGGDERSAAAYCRAFYSKAAPIRQGYVDANRTAKTDPLGAALKLFSAPGDFESIFDGMVDHAPDEIKSDTVVVRDNLKKAQETMGKAFSDPLGALGESIGSGLSSAGAYQRVDAYLNEHCPVDSDLAQKYIREARSGQ